MQMEHFWDKTDVGCPPACMVETDEITDGEDTEDTPSEEDLCPEDDDSSHADPGDEYASAVESAAALPNSQESG